MLNVKGIAIIYSKGFTLNTAVNKDSFLMTVLAFILIANYHDNPKGKGLHAHCYLSYLTSLAEEDKSFYVLITMFSAVLVD